MILTHEYKKGDIMTAKGTCEKHGEFVLTEGCSECLAKEEPNYGPGGKEANQFKAQPETTGSLAEAAREAGAEVTEVKMEVKSSDVACPFCGETGFDLAGLKWHLTGTSIFGNLNCEVYQNEEM